MNDLWYGLDAGHVASVWRRQASRLRSRAYAKNPAAVAAERTLESTPRRQRANAIIVLDQWVRFMNRNVR